MTYVILSILLGMCAWACPIVGLCQSDGSKRKNLYVPIISFTLCLISICVQLLLLTSYGDVWILIVDALDALDFAIPVFSVITVVLNMLYVKKIEKGNSR